MVRIIKKVSFALIIAILTTLFFGVVACYQKQGGPIKDIAGTYVLEKKTQGYDSSGLTQDLIEKNEMVEYIVVGEDGLGFRVYGDKDTPLYCRQIGIRFIPEEENPNSFEYIEYVHYQGENPTKLAYYAEGKKLNFGTPQLKSGCVDVDATSISYKFVSKDQTLKTVEKELGQTFTYKPFDLYNIMGRTFKHELYCSNISSDGFISKDSEYIYKILDFKYENELKVDIYYALRSDKTAVVEEGVSYTYEAVPVNGNDIGRLILTIKGEEYSADSYGFSIFKKVIIDEIECDQSYESIYRDNLTEYVQSLLDSYIESEIVSAE